MIKKIIKGAEEVKEKATKATQEAGQRLGTLKDVVKSQVDNSKTAFSKAAGAWQKVVKKEQVTQGLDVTSKGAEWVAKGARMAAQGAENFAQKMEKTSEKVRKVKDRFKDKPPSSSSDPDKT